jgi:hypothetical protein
MKTIAAVLFCLCVACSGYAQNKGFENIQYIEQPSTGVLRLQVTGYGKNARDCIEDAQKNAFRVILYRGIPESAASTPLIPGDITGDHMDQKVSTFFNDAAYKRFITRIEQFSKPQRTKMGKKVLMDMDIDFYALRSYFEQIGVTRKFGY